MPTMLLTMKRGTTKADAAIAQMRAQREQAYLAAAPLAPSTRALARTSDVPQATARDWNTRLQPVLQECRSLLKEDLVPLMLEMAFRATLDARDATDAVDRRNQMVSAGIAVEKYQLISGAPTQITAHLEEVRVTLPQLLSRIIDIDKGGELGTGDAVTTVVPELPVATVSKSGTTRTV